MASGWQILNVPEFKAGLARIQKDMDLVSQVAVVEAGIELQHLASAAAPRISGLLAGSIDVKGPKRIDGEWAALVGPTIVYGRRIELGFKGRETSKKGWSKGYSRRGLQPTPAEPFLRPTLMSSGDRLAQVFAAAWRKVWR